MKIDFNQELKTIEGDTLKRNKMLDGGTSVHVPATLKWAAIEALLSSLPEEKTSGEEKGRRYELALRIQEAAEPLDLSIEDIACVKKLCDANFAPLIVGQTRRMLEGAKTP